jgi:hypothetical protein
MTSLSRTCKCGISISLFEVKCKDCWKLDQAKKIAKLKARVEWLEDAVEKLLKKAQN